MPDATIRLLEPSDLDAYRALRLRMLAEHPDAFGSDAASFAAQPDAEVAERLRASADRFFLGAFVDGALAGSVGFFREARPKVRHKGTLVGVYVAPERRRLGLARALLEAALRRARSLEGLEQVHLAVVTDNRAARILYASLGFTSYGVEPRALKVDGTYRDEDLMVLRL